MVIPDYSKFLVWKLEGQVIRIMAYALHRLDVGYISYIKDTDIKTFERFDFMEEILGCTDIDSIESKLFIRDAFLAWLKEHPEYQLPQKPVLQLVVNQTENVLLVKIKHQDEKLRCKGILIETDKLTISSIYYPDFDFGRPTILYLNGEVRYADNKIIVIDCNDLKFADELVKDIEDAVTKLNKEWQQK